MKKGKIIVGMSIAYFITATGIYCARMNSGFAGIAVAQEAQESVGEPENTQDSEASANDGMGMDLLSRHSLPGLERMEKEDQDHYVNNLQVIKKMERLGLDTEDFLYPEFSISNIEAAIRTKEDSYCDNGKKVDFRGATSQELQQVIDENPDAVIDIISDQIRINETVVLHDNTIINGNGARFIGEGVTCGVMAQGVSKICLSNIVIEGKIDYGMYFVNCNNLNITQNTIEGCRQKAVYIEGPTEGLIICNNEMSDNQTGALYIAGDVSQGLIEGNTILDNNGNSDWMAGIVLSNASPVSGDDTGTVLDDRLKSASARGKGRLDCPSDIILKNNIISNNASAGIYSDGAYKCYLLNNRVSENDKEGIILNRGTIGFYLSQNTLEHNGCRSDQPDDDLKDGLAGISLDNAAYVVLENNNITDNYGGGIKMARTAIRNLVIGNVIRNNSIGQSGVYGFYGIELGAGLDGKQNPEVDCTPAYENIICRNIISGKHYSGIYIEEECYINDVFDNVIMDSEVHGIEAVSLKFNSMMNNTTNCGIYNEFQ